MPRSGIWPCQRIHNRSRDQQGRVMLMKSSSPSPSSFSWSSRR